MATSAGLATTSSASARGGQGWADGPSHNDLGDLVGRLPGNRKGRPKKEPESSLLFTKPAPQTARGGPRPGPTPRRRVYACPACLASRMSLRKTLRLSHREPQRSGHMGLGATRKRASSPLTW